MSFTIYEGVPISLRVTISILPRWNRICSESNGREPFDRLMERLVEKPRMNTRTEIEKAENGGSFLVKWPRGSEIELEQLIEQEFLALGLPKDFFTLTHANLSPYEPLPRDKEKAEALFKRMFEYESETE